MATLHQLNTSHKLVNCLKLLAATDQLLLIESAVTLAVDANFLQQLPSSVKVLALSSDLQARGLLTTCPAIIQTLSDAQWVAATLEADRVCSW